MKKWVFRDTDGNLPTREEIEQFRRWFTRDDAHPIVYSTIQFDPETNETLGAEFFFEARPLGETMAAKTALIARAEAINEELGIIIEKVKSFAHNRDMKGLRLFLKMD